MSLLLLCYCFKTQVLPAHDFNLRLGPMWGRGESSGCRMMLLTTRSWRCNHPCTTHLQYSLGRFLKAPIGPVYERKGIVELIMANWVAHRSMPALYKLSIILRLEHCSFQEGFWYPLGNDNPCFSVVLLLWMTLQCNECMHSTTLSTYWSI